MAKTTETNINEMLKLVPNSNEIEDDKTNQEEAHMIPEEAIITSLLDIQPDKFYLIVYIKPKSEEEMKFEHQVSNRVIIFVCIPL